MKKLIFILFSILFYQTVSGQDIILTGGGGGHFIIGPATIIQPVITDYLKEPQVLGATYNATPIALQFGGEGYAMLNKWLVGGGGFALAGFTNSTDVGKVTIGGAGGYFKTGYRFWTKATNFFTANIGIGSFGYSIELENTSAENGIAFRQTEPLTIGEKKSYTFGSMMFDPGLSFKGLIIGSSDENGFGGFILGVDAGCMLNVPVGDWKADHGTVIEGPPSPGSVAVPYLRLTLGGGGFGYRK